MLSFLLLSFAIFAKAADLITTVQIYAGYTKEEIQEKREEQQKAYDEAMKECRKIDYMKDYCEIMYAVLKPTNMISEDEVEETIKKLDSYSILINSYGYFGKIDLSQMKGRAAVVSILVSDRAYLDSHYLEKTIDFKGIAQEMQSIKPNDNSLNNVLKIHKILMSHDKREKSYGNNEVLDIVGGIKNKVGYLQVTSMGGSIRIVESPLNSNSALFLFCRITSDSEPIHSDFLAVDLNTYNSLNMENIAVKQFFLSLFSSDYDNYLYQKIHYGSSSWMFYVSKNDISYTKVSFTLPYSVTESFGVLTECLNFIISRVSEEIELKGLNITVGEAVPSGTSSNLQEKETIDIKFDSTWEGTTEKPKIHVVADKTKFELSQEAIALGVKIDDHYKETPPKKSNKTGIIIGVVVAVVVVIIVVVVVVVIVLKKKKAKDGSSNQEGGDNEGENQA